jgi:predicted TIM-barrel fold metal-dependent hydrolase
VSLRDEFFEKGRVEDCPIYDMHGHMGEFYGINMPLADTADMVAEMDGVGVKMLVFNHHTTLLSPDVGNSVGIEAVRKYPERLRAYCGLNGNYPEICKKDVESFDDYSDVYLGFKLHGDTHGVPVTADVYTPMWEMADDRQLLVLLHTWDVSPFDGVSLVRPIAEKYPNAQILCGHSFHADWDNAMKLANDHPNIYLELTAVLDERGILERFIENVSSEKIIFGTDFPWFDHHYYIGGVLGAGCSDDDCRNIFYRNAERLISNISK